MQPLCNIHAAQTPLYMKKEAEYRSLRNSKITRAHNPCYLIIHYPICSCQHFFDKSVSFFITFYCFFLFFYSFVVLFFAKLPSVPDTLPSFTLFVNKFFEIYTDFFSPAKVYSHPFAKFPKIIYIIRKVFIFILF